MSPAVAGGFLTAGPAGKFPDEASDSLEHVGLPLVSLCPWTSPCTSQCLSCYIQKMRLIGLPSQPVAGVEFISTGQMRSTVPEPCFPLGTVELASMLNLQFLESQCTEPSVTSHCLSDLADFTSHSQIISVDYSYSHVSFSFIAYHQLSSFFC